jgi:hypothetical protein
MEESNIVIIKKIKIRGVIMRDGFITKYSSSLQKTVAAEAIRLTYFTAFLSISSLMSIPGNYGLLHFVVECRNDCLDSGCSKYSSILSQYFV